MGYEKPIEKHNVIVPTHGDTEPNADLLDGVEIKDIKQLATYLEATEDYDAWVGFISDALTDEHDTLELEDGSVEGVTKESAAMDVISDNIDHLSALADTDKAAFERLVNLIRRRAARLGEREDNMTINYLVRSYVQGNSIINGVPKQEDDNFDERRNALKNITGEDGVKDVKNHYDIDRVLKTVDTDKAAEEANKFIALKLAYPEVEDGNFDRVSQSEEIKHLLKKVETGLGIQKEARSGRNGSAYSARGGTSPRPHHQGTTNRFRGDGSVYEDVDEYEVQQMQDRYKLENSEEAAQKEISLRRGRLNEQIGSTRKIVKIGKNGSESEKLDIIRQINNSRDMGPITNLDGTITDDKDKLENFFRDFFGHYEERLKWLEDSLAEINNGPEEADPQVNTNQPSGETDDEVAGRPTGAGVLDKPLTLSFIDQSRDAEVAARDAAEARRRDELQTGGRFKQFLKSMWKGENGLAGAYYLEKYKREALAGIQQENDILLHESGDLAARNSAQLATIERFQSEYEESIHDAAGEKREELSGDSEFAVAMKDLIARYVSGEIADADSLEEERSRILQQMSDSGNGVLLGEGKVRIDNLIAIADQVKAMVDHVESIERVLEGMKIYSGEARSGVRSEAYLSKAEKLIERLQQSKIGSLVGPETIGAAASVAIGAWHLGRGSIARAAGATVMPGVLGGLFAAARENKRVKQERAIHAREVAQGKVYDSGPRREQMESTRYNTVGAAEATQQLQEILTNSEPTPEQVRAAYEAVCAIEARVTLSDGWAGSPKKPGIDLISFSDATKVESERRELDEARALAKQWLSGRLDALPEEFRNQFGIEASMPVNEAVGKYTDVATELAGDISAKDKAFAKLKRRRVIAAGATGFATSAVMGIGAQEALAFASPSYSGLAEHILRGTGEAPTGGHQTTLEAIFNGESSKDFIVPSATYETHTIPGSKVAVQLPDNYNFVTDKDGSISVQAPNMEMVVEGIKLDNGKLTDESLAALNGKNITIADKSYTIPHESTTTKEVSIAEYNKAHAKDLVHIKRDFWYDNNTPGKYEKNELGLRWAGDGGNGSSGNGGVQMAVNGMNQGGSIHHGEQISWSKEASEGDLKLAVSSSTGTQSHVYMVDVQSNGKIDIPADHPAAKLFATDSDGQMQFKGGYAEVVEVRGESGGRTHVAPLATLSGDNSIKTIEQAITTRTEERIINLKMTPPPIEVIHNLGVEGFGAPGFVPRRPLEMLRRSRGVTQPSADPFTYEYGGGRLLEDMRRWVKAYPARLKTRRMIDSNGDRRWVEVDGSPVERNVDRERRVMSEYLADQYKHNPSYESHLRGIADELGPMTDDCRVSVNIPAWLEEKSLKGLLMGFFDQRDKDGNVVDPSIYEVNILINRKEGTKGDNSVSAIEEFITRYVAINEGRRPKVNYVDIELESDNATVGYARKLLTDATLLRSLDRSHQSAPLYIESEDADLALVDKRVIVNLISKLDSNPHLDAVRGIEGRLSVVLKENDLLVMRRNAWETFLLLSRQKRYRDPTVPTWNSFANRTITGGWNTGYSAEVYALIGGYEPVRSGEDILIGEKISMIRGDGEYPNLETIGTVPTRTESSPRRFIYEIISNKAAYDDFGEEGVERYLRDKSTYDLMDEIAEYDRIKEANRPVFEAEATMFYDWCKNATPTILDAQEMVKRVMLSVGYREGDYRITDSKIEITNWSNVTNNLDAYRTQYMSALSPNRKVMISGWKRPDLRVVSKE